MQRGIATIAAFLSLLAATCEAGAATVPTPMPDIKPDWRSMRFELGTWHCSTVFARTSGTAFETVVNSMTLDDHWMLTRSASPPFKARTKEWVLDGYIGYDRSSQLWVFFGATNFGFWSFQTSPGWQGDTITWTVYDLSKGQPAIVGREILTKQSTSETRNVLQNLEPNGAWSPRAVQVCNKRSQQV